MGLAVRLCLIGMWLVLMGLHTWKFVLPGLGVVERHDLSAGLARQLDRSLSYDLIRPATDGTAKRLGGSDISVSRDDAGFRCDLRFELDALPGFSRPSTDGHPAIRITATEKLDDRFRLTAITAEGEAMGMPITATAVVDHRGLTGTLMLAGKAQNFTLPNVGRDDGAAMDLGLTLPPGLKPGDTFKSKMLDIGITMTPTERVSVFTAVDREPIVTKDGELTLLKVVVSTDGKTRATYWCDDDGTVYRAALGDGTMVMELVRIRGAAGQAIWPKGPTP